MQGSSEILLNFYHPPACTHHTFPYIHTLSEVKNKHELPIDKQHTRRDWGYALLDLFPLIMSTRVSFVFCTFPKIRNTILFSEFWIMHAPMLLQKLSQRWKCTRIAQRTNCFKSSTKTSCQRFSEGSATAVIRFVQCCGMRIFVFHWTAHISWQDAPLLNK